LIYTLFAAYDHKELQNNPNPNKKPDAYSDHTHSTTNIEPVKKSQPQHYGRTIFQNGTMTSFMNTIIKNYTQTYPILKNKFQN
jgi:hypothetical protein